MLSIALTCGCNARAAPGDFCDPQPVRIEGYDGEVMEPFLSRDGTLMFFNNRNDPSIDTDLFWAERVDDRRFRFRGPLDGANSRDLDAVASLDRDGNFYFVSARDYAATGALIHRGHFHDGRVDGVEIVRGLASKDRPGFNFDAEVSADGRQLYYVESARGGDRATLAVADRTADGFAKSARSDALLRAVNAGSGMIYAPATTEDGLALFFTRGTPGLMALFDPPHIYAARRDAIDQPFGAPHRITAIEGFAEAPTIAPDGATLYYHAQVNGRFALYRVVRCAGP